MVVKPPLTGDRLDDAVDDQSGIQEAIDQRGQHAVDLPHPRHEPSLFAGAFVGVVVQAPACASACVVEHPAIARQARRKDGVLG